MFGSTSVGLNAPVFVAPVISIWCSFGAEYSRFVVSMWLSVERIITSPIREFSLAYTTMAIKHNAGATPLCEAYQPSSNQAAIISIL